MSDEGQEGTKPPGIFSPDEKANLIKMKREVNEGKRSEDPVDQNKLEFYRSIKDTLQQEEGVPSKMPAAKETSETATTVGASSVIIEAEAVAEKGWDASTVPLDASKDTATEEEILKKIDEEFAQPDKKDEYEKIDDFTTEPLPTQEREQVRDIYQSILRVLPNFGFEERDLAYGTATPHEKPIHVLGVPGKFDIHIGRDIERDEKGMVAKETGKYLLVRSIIPTKEGERETFVYRIDSDGFATDRDGLRKGSEYRTNDAGPSQELLSRIQTDLSPWIEGMSNPDNSPEHLRERVLAIRDSLANHFKAKGIEPRMDTVDYHYTPSRIVEELAKAAGAEYQQKQPQTYQIKVGHEFPIGKIPGMDGEWVVQFEADQSNPLMRAEGTFTPKEEEHGLGIIISRLDPEDARRQIMEKRRFRYEFWENGDVVTPHASTGHMIDIGPAKRYARDPHQAVIEAHQLEHALTGNPLPKDVPGDKQSRLRNWMNKLGL